MGFLEKPANTKFKTIQQKIPIDRYNYDISNDILNGKIQLDEVEKALGRIRKGKASGIDGIPIELYTSDIKYFPPLLTTLFNTIFDSADYTDDWAQGLIYPVHKKGDKSDPQNYRFDFESVLENRLSFKNLCAVTMILYKEALKKIVGHLIIYLCCTI